MSSAPRRAPAAAAAAAAVARTTIGLALLAFAAGCHDSTAPGSDAHITVSVDKVSAPDLSAVADDGSPLIGCTTYLRAIDDGHADVVWRDATFYYYAGQDRATPVDSQSISEAVVAESWGSPRLAPRFVQTAAWSFTAGVPFGAAIDYRYQAASGGPEKHARVTFTCGPEAPAGAPAPAISSLAVSPETGKIQSGDMLTIDYAASSAVGLWETALTVSGPCVVTRRFAEQLHTSTTHTVKIVLPPECRLGEPLQVNLLAKDAAGQSAFRSLPLSLALVDERPPQIIVASPFDPSLSNYVRGDYFLGDTIDLDVWAFDNHALRAVVWEVLPSGDRDSVVVSGAAASTKLRIPVRPTWVGPIRLRLYARDAVELSSDTITSVDGELRVYPSVDRPTATGTIVGDVNGLVAFDARRQVLYVVQPDEQRIAVFSLATMQVTSTIPVPGTPGNVELTPSGDSLLLTSPYRQSLGVVDLRQPSPAVVVLPLQGLDPATLAFPNTVRVAANGKVFAALGGGGANALIEIDLRTGAQHVRSDAGTGGAVGSGASLVASADRSKIVITSAVLQAYDATTDAFGPMHALDIDHSWSVPAVDGTGRRTAVRLDVYDASMQPLGHVHALIGGGRTSRTALSANGEYLYYADWARGLVRSRLSDGAIVDRTPLATPIGPATVLVSPDGTTLVMIESSSTVGTAAPKTVTRIDLR